MNTEIKNNFFRDIFDMFLEGRSFTIFLGPTKISYQQGDKEISVNDGIDTKVPYDDETPMYVTASMIIDIASKHETDLNDLVEKYVEFRNTVLNASNQAENIVEFEGILCQHIRTSKRLVILADDLSEFDESDNYGIACAIKNIQLRKEHEAYRVREEIARKMYDDLQVKNSEDRDSSQVLEVLYYETLTNGEELFIFKNNTNLSFSLMLMSDKKIISSKAESYERPSTFMSLAWAYANIVSR